MEMFFQQLAHNGETMTSHTVGSCESFSPFIALSAPASKKAS
jgi:hypothetical protein